MYLYYLQIDCGIGTIGILTLFQNIKYIPQITYINISGIIYIFK